MHAMSDFVELGLEAADHLLDNHFDKIPDEVFSPRGTLHNIRHRRQKHPKLDRIEGRSPPSASQSPNDASPRSSMATAPQRKSSQREFEDKESEGPYEGDEGKPIGNRRGDRSQSRRSRPREDPYYHDAEQRTQNPRDYDPECLGKDNYSPRNLYWAQPHSTHPLNTIATGPSSSSPYVSHPAGPSHSTQQWSPTPPTTGLSSPYAQANTSRRRSMHAPNSAVESGLNNPYFKAGQRTPPPNSPITRGAPSQRYDTHSPNPPPNADPYYPAHQHRSPSPKPPPPPSSISYAAAAFTPYPYHSSAAAAAAFGAERPFEYEHNPYHPPRERHSRSRSRSRSRSGRRPSHGRRHRHRHRHRTDRPGITRRASSTGGAPYDLDRPRSTQRSPRQNERPLVRRRASSTGDVSLDDPTDRKRDFGLPSKLSGSDRALGAGGAGALVGGFLAQEVGSLLRKQSSKGGEKPMVLTLLGAVVGGLGANLLASKGERRLKGERGSMREWADDVKGQRRKGAMGWRADDRDMDQSRDGEQDGTR